MLRLPIYQRLLLELVRGGSRTVSSEQLAELARVNAAKVRKDLSLLGSFGTRGSGYNPDSSLPRSTAPSASTRTGRWPWWASATWAGR